MRYTFRPSFAHALLALCLVSPGGVSASSADAHAGPPQRRSRTQANSKKRTPPKKTAGATEEARPAAELEPKQNPTAQEIKSSFLIRWQGNQGVERYRLQVARDAEFNDIVFDRAVIGREYRVTELPTGTYFWRVAPAAGETGSFTRPAPVEAVAGPGGTSSANVIVPSNNTGWRTATGEVLNPVPAQLRTGRASDLVAVNREGTIYALDGQTGVAMWLTRFRPGVARTEERAAANPATTFTPFTVAAREGGNNVVVAYDGGIRALRGLTGREVWRANLSVGNATGGVTSDLNGDGKAEIAVVAGKPSTLYVIDAETGFILSETKLESAVVDAPVPHGVGEERGVLLALENGTLELRRAYGEKLRSANLESGLTTAPHAVQTSRGLIVMVGSERGLEALDGSKLAPIGRITTEGDTVRGTLRSVDLDADGESEVVLVTKRGRVAVVNTSDGKIRWFAEGASDASAASFADVNGDGTLDVLAPAGALFAVGFSGRDGSLIWRVEEAARSAGSADASGAATTRSLAIMSLVDDAAFIVGGEPSRTALRAVELPKGATRRAAAN